MLKIIGGIIVVSASFLFGYNIKKKMKFECELTENLKDGFYALKEDIRYNSDYLLNSVRKAISVSGKAEAFFQKILEELESGKSVDESLETAALLVPSADIRNLICDAGKKIGKTDSEGQIALLDMLIERIDIFYKKQAEFYEKQGGIYPKFGIAFGILITILLI